MRELDRLNSTVSKLEKAFKELHALSTPWSSVKSAMAAGKTWAMAEIAFDREFFPNRRTAHDLTSKLPGNHKLLSRICEESMRAHKTALLAAL